MGPLTKRRHSTHRSGRRQAGQPKIQLIAKAINGLIGKRARKQAKKQVNS
ncbi:hypothetical protein KBD71_03090 [Candidatus Woesebacteria bacterium]|nr:hypothetical protein [Candidatus Woesebacteria bacterium]